MRETVHMFKNMAIACLGIAIGVPVLFTMLAATWVACEKLTYLLMSPIAQWAGWKW